MQALFNQSLGMPNPAWVTQQMNQMTTGINDGKTRKRNVASVAKQNTDEEELAKAARLRGWKMAQVGDDYVFAPGDYTIRPIV
jgi:hypothetical protein